jgi:hypothetical protein
MSEELQRPEVFDRGCDERHWNEIAIYGKCFQCGAELYYNNKKPI